MVWRIGWKIGGKIRQWERIIGRSDAILKNRMESEGLWHVRLDRMDHIRLFISIIARNALWDKHNKNRIRLVWQWEWKMGWDLSKHESHPITFVNKNAIKLFKIEQWDASFRGFFILLDYVQWPVALIGQKVANYCWVWYCWIKDTALILTKEI